ncbi:MAG: hypothetical protein H6733_14340 [Alphaproteobacteria bacterium]|nr:hypothetical protein [Alphaproteobacteria bacterium]
MDVVGVVVVGLVSGVLLVAYLRAAREPALLEGEPLVGSVGTVTLSVPRDGVGTVALLLGGRRVARPCVHQLPTSLAAGTSVRVVDVRRGLLVVERA